MRNSCVAKMVRDFGKRIPAPVESARLNVETMEERLTPSAAFLYKAAPVAPQHTALVQSSLPAAEKVALEYADAITDTNRDVDDELFQRLQQYYDDDTIAELTMIIAWENASSRFNRAFRIPSQGFWKR